MPTAICHYCGETFLPERSTGKYCSGKCRTAYHRLKTNAEKSTRLVERQLRNLQGIVERYPELTPTINILFEEIRDELNQLERRKWQCGTCGQLAFGKEAPHRCAYCRSSYADFRCLPNGGIS